MLYKKRGGAHQSGSIKHLGSENGAKRRRHPSSDYSTSNSGSEPQYLGSSTPYQQLIEDHRDLPGPSCQENLDTFMDSNTGDLYLYVKSYHIFPTNSTVTLNGVVTPIKWHHSRQAFTVLRRNHQEEIPYMGVYHAHDTILAFQNIQPGAVVTGNMNRKCYPKHFNESSGIAKALCILEEDTPSVIGKMLRKNNEDKPINPF